MNEEIKRLIEGGAKIFVKNTPNTCSNFVEYGFTKGAEFGYNLCISKWQEAERWRKVEVELPEVKEFGVSDYVLTKCEHESYQVAQYCKNKYYPDGSWFNPDRELSITPVEWKPIS